MTIVTIPFFNTAKHAINWGGGHGGQKLTILDRYYQNYKSPYFYPRNPYSNSDRRIRRTCGVMSSKVIFIYFRWLYHSLLSPFSNPVYRTSQCFLQKTKSVWYENFIYDDNYDFGEGVKAHSVFLFRRPKLPQVQ